MSEESIPYGGPGLPERARAPRRMVVTFRQLADVIESAGAREQGVFLRGLTDDS